MSKNLCEILGELGLDNLPPKETEDSKGEKIWVKALALTTRHNGSKEYVLLKRDENFKQYVIEDYGCTSAIFHIDEIYPLVFLSSDYVKGFDDNSREDRIKYLEYLELPYASSLNFEKMSLEDLNKEIVRSAIYLQNLESKNMSRKQEIKQYKCENFLNKETEEKEETKEEPIVEKKEEPTDTQVDDDNQSIPMANQEIIQLEPKVFEEKPKRGRPKMEVKK